MNASCIWEVRNTNGIDTNGGGFAPAGQSAWAITDLTTNANTGNTTTPIVSSATYTFVAGDVNNYLYISAGTNWTIGEYQIVSVSAGKATLGRACALVGTPTGGSCTIDYSQQNAAIATGTASSAAAVVTATTSIFTPAMVGNLITNGTTWFQIITYTNATTVTVDGSPSWTTQSVSVGGALKTISKLFSVMVTSNHAWIKGGVEGAYLVTATYTMGTQCGTATAILPTRIIGYGATRGDSTKPILRLNAISVGFIMDLHTNPRNVSVENIEFDGNSQTGGYGLNGCIYQMVHSCYFHHCIGTANSTYLSSSLASIINCQFSSNANSGNGSYICALQYGVVYNCYFSSNTPGSGCVFISGGAGLSGTVANCIFANNTMQSSAGTVNLTSDTYAIVINNTFYNNSQGTATAGDVNAANYTNVVKNNIFANALSGLSTSSSAIVGDCFLYDGNAYYSNTNNKYNIGPSTTWVVPAVFGVSPYTNVLDVTLTASPFTNAAAGDFTLNNTAGGGAALRGTATPGTIQGISQTGYMDFGALQTVSPAPSRLLYRPRRMY